MKNKNEDSRYPYTYACDYIRAIAGYNENGTKLSRSDASQIRQVISEVIGVDDYEVACKLADKELNKTDDDYINELNEFFIARGGV